MSSANGCLFVFSSAFSCAHGLYSYFKSYLWSSVFCIGTLPHVSDCLILLLTNMNITFCHRRAVAVLGATSGHSGSGATAAVLVAANPWLQLPCLRRATWRVHLAATMVGVMLYLGYNLFRWVPGSSPYPMSIILLPCSSGMAFVPYRSALTPAIELLPMSNLLSSLLGSSPVTWLLDFPLFNCLIRSLI